MYHGKLHAGPMQLTISSLLRIRYETNAISLLASCEFISQRAFSSLQLFYPNAKGKDLWYDPVFRVETIDGRNVWCKVSTTSASQLN